MDWIEQWLGISPDNGDGSLETLLLIAIVMLPVGLRILRTGRIGYALRRLFMAR